MPKSRKVSQTDEKRFSPLSLSGYFLSWKKNSKELQKHACFVLLRFRPNEEGIICNNLIETCRIVTFTYMKGKIYQKFYVQSLLYTSCIFH